MALPPNPQVNSEVRDIAARIDSIEARNTNLNMERVVTDLAQVKSENKELTKQIKKIKGV